MESLEQFSKEKIELHRYLLNRIHQILNEIDEAATRRVSQEHHKLRRQLQLVNPEQISACVLELRKRQYSHLAKIMDEIVLSINKISQTLKQKQQEQIRPAVNFVYKTQHQMKPQLAPTLAKFQVTIPVQVEVTHPQTVLVNVKPANMGTTQAKIQQKTVPSSSQNNKSPVQLNTVQEVSQFQSSIGENHNALSQLYASSNNSFEGQPQGSLDICNQIYREANDYLNQIMNRHRVNNYSFKNSSPRTEFTASPFKNT